MNNNNYMWDAIIVSIRDGIEEFIHHIIAVTNDINITDENNWTMLYWAIQLKKYDMVKLLVAYNPDFTIKSSQGLIPTNIAVDNGEFEILKLLIENGADANFKDDFNITPIYRAIQCSNIEIFEWLLENGGINDINEKLDKHDWTLLHLAAITWDYEIVDILLAAGASPNIADAYGWTPLHLVCQSDCEYDIKVQTHIIAALIKYGIDIDAQDNNGQTALYTAIWNQYAEAVALLVAAGANKEIRNYSNYGCFDIAFDPEIKNILSYEHE